MVIQIGSLGELNRHLNEADANRLIVVDFYADWCPPCRAIAPFYEGLASTYKNASFLKINVDNCRDISAMYGVKAMPTFLFLKQGREVARIQGANAESITQTINQHYNEVNPNAATELERQFLSQLVHHSQGIAHFTDLVSKTLALSLIPSEKLLENATVNGKVNQFELAKELLLFFKTEFFSWCDSPICQNCSKQTPKESYKHGTPSLEEKEFECSTVEIYECGDCKKDVRFPRYNNPQKLLETRTGRCGEWANCFCLMAAAMDFDVRFVYDVTDHVWVELWIPELDRWVHCDPCENVIDKPYLYEKGWNKKLSYVIAYGLDHVVDTTWSYSERHKSLLKRRNQVRESVLANFLQKLSKRVATNYGVDDAREKELQRRRIRELIQSIHVGRSRKDSNSYEGRSTGSVEWRLARGELGASPKKKQPVVIRPNDEELATKKLKLTYNASRDVYTRGTTTSKGWSSLLFKSKDVQRKVEADWKMVYLCRKEGKEEGEITWAIDLTGVKVKEASVRFTGNQEFENARVTLSVCADEMCVPLPSSGYILVNSPPSCLLKITANFTGGQGDNAFQHAQLFRSALDSVKNQLEFDITFE